MDDNALNKLIHNGIIFSFYRSLTALPSFPGKTLAWVQLLLVDEQQTVQLKLHALGPLVASPGDDSNFLDLVDRSREEVVEHSRKLFKDAAPFFMNDFGLWIFSRSMVRKGNNGSIDAAAQPAREFAKYDPLENLSQVPMDPSSKIRCAEISATVRRSWTFFIVSTQGMAFAKYMHSLWWLDVLTRLEGSCGNSAEAI